LVTPPIPQLSHPAAPPWAARSSPKVFVVWKFLECRVVARRHNPGQRQPEYRICNDRRVAHIEIDGIQSVPHMQLWIITQATAAKPFVPFADPPTDHVPNHVVIEMQVES